MNQNLLKLYFNSDGMQQNQGNNGMPDSAITKNQSVEHSTPSINPKLNQDLSQVKDIFESFRPKVNKLTNKINNYDTFIKQNRDNQAIKESHPVLEGVISTIPNARRIINVENNVENNNPTKAVGLGLLAIITLKEDLRDLLSIFGLSKSEAPEGYFSKFKFFAGTPIESWLLNRKWGKNILNSWDTTLADAKLGNKVYSFFKIEENSQFYNKETRIPFLRKDTVTREYLKFEGSFIGKLSCLALNRITKIGLIFMSLLEVPTIYKAIKNNKDYSQIPESAVNVISCTFCGALFSALLSLITGIPAGSVIGLGLGLFIGNKLSKLIFKNKQ
ncbi:MAG: hypothetical protein PHC34_04335 [Candidatus Gastranaerophilales bacterium]|nr:hypothetical protein [Candidatus Gastranaerophilales bacterium]